MKLGINIKSSEILINNGEIPFSYLERMIINFSEKKSRDASKIFTFQVYRNDEGIPVKIYEFYNDKKKDLKNSPNKLLEKKVKFKNGNILLIKSCSSTKRNSITKSQMKK